MLPEIGLILLIISLSLACWQGLQCALLSPSHLMMQSYRRTNLTQFIFVLAAFAMLVICFLNNTISVVAVMTHSHASLPWWYRLSAVWAGHEGSMLLWLLILSFWMVMVGQSRGLSVEIRRTTLFVMNTIFIVMAGFICLTSNPFTRQFNVTNADGTGLNPLLQDPGLMIHPPILFMGYVGTAVMFAFAVAVLWQGQAQREEFEWCRKWSLLAWAFLTAGITLGSWWAYRVLGWGGWWFWDPVENASFLPWLACTALIHALMMVRKNHAFLMWTLFLCVLSFMLSLLGSFLVRSGVLTSVHAFASDPSRGIYILSYFCLMMFAVGTLFITRLNHWSTTCSDGIGSRQFYLLSNSTILFCLLLTVLLGTIYPLFAEILTGVQLSVGAPYFNRVSIPFAIILMLLMACAWLRQSFRWPLLSLAMTLGCAWLLLDDGVMSLVLGLVLWVAGVTIVSASQGRRNGQGGRMSLATFLSHLGVCVIAIGIIVSSCFSQQQDVRLKVGDSIQLGATTFHLKKLQGVRDGQDQAMQLLFDVRRHDIFVTEIQAEKRFYQVANTVISRPGIHPGLWRDYYIAIGDPIPPNQWTVRLYVKPFIRWIWFGGVMILLGALIGFARCRFQDLTYVKTN